MNTKNLEYLKDGLKYTGFGDKLYDELEKNMQTQAPEFQLKMQIPYNNTSMDYLLHFRKSDQSDRYFFNKYEATLKTPTPDQDKSQTFYINKNSGITAREAYNLLNGRSVLKNLVNAEEQPYKAWLQLDPNVKDAQGNHKMKQYHENYGFDLAKTLDKFDIKELQDPEQKAQIVSHLQKGNMHFVTARLEGNEVMRFIEASPQYKTINVYDEQLRQVKRESILKQEFKHGTAVKQEYAEHNKAQKQSPPASDEPKEKRSRKRGMGL